MWVCALHYIGVQLVVHVPTRDDTADPASWANVVFPEPFSDIQQRFLPCQGMLTSITLMGESFPT